MRAAGHATRERILTAARAEFARHGVAGARINRIAADAHASKDRLYAYFPGKTELYAAVTEQWATETTTSTALRAEDLPGYAGRLFDHFVAHPDDARLQAWADLEALDPRVEAVLRRATMPKLEEVRRGQRDGLVTADFTPVALLRMLTDLTRTAATHVTQGRQEHDRVERQRAAVILAVRRLVAP